MPWSCEGHREQHQPAWHVLRVSNQRMARSSYRAWLMMRLAFVGRQQQQSSSRTNPPPMQSHVPTEEEGSWFERRRRAKT
jgi:hypothetical protein